MNKCELKVSLLIIFQLTSMYQVPSEATFHQKYDHLLAIMDDIFMSLKIHKNSTNPQRVTNYQSMHFVQDAIEKNHKNYEELNNITKTNMSHKIFYYISNINELIEDMIRKQRLKTPNVTYESYNEMQLVSEDDTLKDFISLAERYNLKLSTLAENLKLSGFKTKKRSLESRRIFNGEATTVIRYPFMASIHVDGSFTCAGSIIREDLVISVASFLAYYRNPYNTNVTPSIDIRVGSNFPNKFGELIPIVDVYFHPKFNKTILRHNLLILKMIKRLDFKKRNLKSIRIDKEAFGLPRNVKRVVIIGWGRTGEYQESENTVNMSLSHAFLNIYDLEECRKLYSRTYVTEESFCAGFVDKGTGACRHDIGGPAIYGSKLMGVSNFGTPDCGHANAPTVFIKLGYYAEWVDSIFKRVPLTSERQLLERSFEYESSSSMEYNNVPKNVGHLNYFLKQGKINNQPAKETIDAHDLVYGSVENDDTFKPTTKLDVMKNPLLSNSIFLDPNLVQLPKFSEEKTTVAPDLLETPPLIVDVDKMQSAEIDIYRDIVSKIFSTTTEATTETEGITLNTEIAVTGDAYDEFVVTPESSTSSTISSTTETSTLMNTEISMTGNAYDEFIVTEVTTTVFETPSNMSASSETASNISSSDVSTSSKSNIRVPYNEVPFTRMNRFVEDSESDRGYDNEEFEYESDAKLSERDVFENERYEKMEIVIKDSGTTRQFVVNKRDPLIQRELKRLENRLF